ncbi:hypothetical protein [Dyella mobilis]|uniref:Uncharacterized protein n=1 Tax=Dyella mobilis TaxID=1849582 RepID=A0ABS2KFC1_9GAMM|nr:hypothetical protein [Dyella mobilis]MBM7129755.1 hypothetical protein [Dyella mobilis]GLQ97980.1 hypothetical protein GCM10007863_24000 [Dyella mobilis]
MKAPPMMMVLWRSTSLTMRWTMLTIAVLIWSASAICAMYLHAREVVWIAAIVDGYAGLFAGLTLLAPSLLLAVDARQLRIPRMHNVVLPGMIFYALTLAAIPSILLTLAGGEFAGIFAIQMLGLTAGTALGLLPRSVAAVSGFVPVLVSSFRPYLALPHWASGGLFCVLAGVALFCSVIAVRWRRQLRSVDPYRLSASRALVMQNRSQTMGWHRWGGWGQSRDSALAMQTVPAWMLPKADLNGTGPRDPARSLRVALGGWLLPITWHSMLLRWVSVLVPMAIIASLCARSAGVSILSLLGLIVHGMTFGVWVWLAGYGGAALSLVVAVTLQQRWRKANAELPLLALLPALGHGWPLVRNLLRASLLRVLTIQAVLLALVLAVALIQHVDAWSVGIALLGQVAAAGIALVFALSNFGGVSVPKWSAGLIAALCFGLVGFDNVCMPFFSPSPVLGGSSTVLLASAWMLVILALGWMAWRGWCGVQRRPHPFLPA